LARDLGGLIKVICTIILVLGGGRRGRGIIRSSLGDIVSFYCGIIYRNDLIELANSRSNSSGTEDC